MKWEKKKKGSLKVLSVVFAGSYKEAYYEDMRLLPVRSPNINTDWSANMNIAQPGAPEQPFHKVKALLKETDTCKRNGTKGFGQSCPQEDKEGFIFDNEFSTIRNFIDQTEIIVFHSWVAERAKIANISHNKVMFQAPLKHAAIGDWMISGNWRYLIINNLAVLDMPGEYVCNDLGNGKAKFSFIPPKVVGAQASHHEQTRDHFQPQKHQKYLLARAEIPTHCILWYGHFQDYSKCYNGPKF